VSTCRGSGERVPRPETLVVLGHGEGLVFPAGPSAPGYDAGVTEPHRRAAHLLVPILTIVLGPLTVACGRGATVPTPRSTASATLAAPSLTPVPGGGTTGAPSGSAGASVSQTETTTAVDRIWDSLPPSFPKLLGQEPAETGVGPISGSFAANMDARTASKLIATLLEGQGWTVDVGSPLEDGTIVLEATGPAAGCKAEVRFTPQSGTVTMAVLYGTACPFG
jgi:hypothetical protein